MSDRTGRQRGTVNPDVVRRIIEQGDYDELVRRAEEWGRSLGRQGLKMTQIRRLFGEVRRLQMRWDPVRLRMLRPRLHYTAARIREGGDELRQILDPAIQAVLDGRGRAEERFKVMVDLFEAILAYFTYHERGGRGERDVHSPEA